MPAIATNDHIETLAAFRTLSTAPQEFEIVPLARHADAVGNLGAEVIGLDLSKPLSEDEFERLQQAHWKHHVLVFRDQKITPEQQVTFSRRWGPLQIHVLRQFQLPGNPEILQVSNIRNADGQPEGLGDAGLMWHSDLSYKQTPSLGSLLHAQELPAEGGDTLFADQHAAYEALPASIKQKLNGLTAEHSYLLHY